MVVTCSSGTTFNIAPTSFYNTASSSSSSTSVVPSATCITNPFILKFKNKQIRVYQSCRGNYENNNDTLGLVISRAENRVISNTFTGTQFTKECNSHYHACLLKADPSFKGSDLQVPAEVTNLLTIYQKIYLTSCLQVPVTF